MHTPLPPPGTIKTTLSSNMVWCDPADRAPEAQPAGHAMEANLCSGMLARAYGLDVLDLHYHFRCLLPHGGPHGEPWDGRAQRWASALLLHHVAAAWGVAMSPPPLLGLRPASRAIRGPAGPAGGCLRGGEGTGTVGWGSEGTGKVG